ncbi:LysR family transcriptional regulator [Neptuniibacter sp.]|uniref:LysR family transcriptional regulator n=1 Tax=Neptuniibacter sp. TaxID=1962643 RepID=UPI0026056D65|nr:LysR family transcriptional regulator [Neptuniibacter sp.]MCP4596210.1 LysR family transcriptional regulator [Neptuniibacter sp.]
MTNNISIRHLRAFIEIAGTGSFTRAADNLHLTQSTLTATIKQLEEQAGLKLLDRTTRRVLLTSQGESFLPVAEKLISDFDTAFNDLQATATQQQGQVGIAASPSMIGRVLPEIVKNYHQQFQKIGIYLRDDNAGGIEQRVLENEVDFGIGGNHSHQPELNYQPVLSDRYGVVLPIDHPLADKEELSWQEISKLPQVHLTEDTGTRSQLLKLEKENNLDLQLQGALIEISTPAGLAEMVKAELGIALLPALAASTIAFDQLRFVPLAKPALHRQICIISRKGRALSPAADTLLEMINQYFESTELPMFVGNKP